MITATARSASEVTEEQAKTSVYGFLADVLSSHPTPDSMSGLGQMSEVLGVAYVSDSALATLDREYMDLFVVPNPRYVAPYESVYRDRWMLPALPSDGATPDTKSQMIKGLLMGDSTLKVQQCFVEAGVVPSDDLPDHIANELRLMAYLSARLSEVSLEDGKALAEIRAKLREEHILQWISQLRARVLESAHLGYYAAALEIAELVLNDDL